MSFIAIVILAVFLLVAGIGMSISFWKRPEMKPVASQQIINSSRSEIEDMLQQIQRKKVPELKMGAQCYSPGNIAHNQEYVCPRDGEKTVYAVKDQGIPWVISQIVGMRRIAEHINSITDLASLRLDESRLCNKCFPDLRSEDRYVSLITKYPDGREHLYPKVSADDLRILVGFFEKKLVYETDQEWERPLKDQAAKIREMLGEEEQ